MRRFALGFLVIGAAGCGPPADCPRCDSAVIAAVGEPRSLLPPLVEETVGRDVSDLVFERLARLRPGGATTDPAAYLPGLAVRWEEVDPESWRFHLRPGARWHDGRPVRAADVVFSFLAYQDTALRTGAASALVGVAATAGDDSTVVVRFPTAHAELLFEATWHVRIIPRHVWEGLPPAQWALDTAVARLVGSGPYRVTARVPGQSVTLEKADSARAGIGRVIWRFAGDPDAALNLVLSGEADLLESVGDSARVARLAVDTAFRPVAYPSAVYGFLGFNLGPRGPAVLRGRAVRRALTQALDRATVARAVFGPDAVAPPGPMSRTLWIWNDSIAVLPWDTAAAREALSNRRISVDILVPGTSVARRNLAQVIQEQWRRIGVTATITSVDFPVFQERIRTGRFQTFVGAWLDEPSPRGLADQWTADGIGVLNYTHYRSRAFEALLARALSGLEEPAALARIWREAMDTLNADAPAVFLYNPTNVAAVARRLDGVTIDPFSWVSGLPAWTIRER